MDPIDAYFNSLPEPRRDALVQVHRLIARAWPRVVTDMSAGMPTYHLNGHAFCALADRKHCMVLHVAHYDLLAVFRHDLLKFDHGRSCIRFTRLAPDLLDLFDRVVKYCGERMCESIHYGRPHKMRGPLQRTSTAGAR